MQRSGPVSAGPMQRATGLLTGNCFRPFEILSDDRHFGPPVFLSGLSSAHTFKIGSLERSSEIVTRSDVPSICLMWVMDPES